MSISSQVVNLAIDYIIENLHMELKVEDVANHCNFSKYYFSRLFRAETGESLYSFIKRLRLEKSAVKLGSDLDRSITDIGLDYGYSSSNYSSAFKKQHKMSPAEFRKLRQQHIFDRTHPFSNKKTNLKSFDWYNERIKVQKLNDLNVLFKRYISSYKDMNKYWQEFLKTYGYLIKDDSKVIEISYDDPKITDKDRCIYDLCLTVDENLNIENKKIVKGGEFAIYEFEGEVMDIFYAYKGIFNIWLPKSKFKIDNRLGFAIYKQTDFESKSYKMDICIPIK